MSNRIVLVEVIRATRETECRLEEFRRHAMTALNSNNEYEAWLAIDQAGEVMSLSLIHI